MAKLHPYGKVVAEVSFGRWRWDDMLQTVCYIPRGRQKPTITLYLDGRHNTEVHALRAIVRELSPRYGGSK